MNWCAAKPVNPVTGDCYLDNASYAGYMFDGTHWIQFSGMGPTLPIKSREPTEEQLEKHPTLKQALDEYLVIRKLLGL